MNFVDKISKLEVLGYNQFFENARLKADVSIDCVARVIAEHKGAYDVIDLDGEHRATVSGKYMLNASQREDYPAVGDWVIIRDDAVDTRVIEAVLPRQTRLRKKYSGKDEAQLIATNIEVAFIVESMDRDYNINRFERYVVLSREGGVTPVIILNKSDLLSSEELNTRMSILKERFNNIDIITTSAIAENGLSSLLKYIKENVTYCFLGSSGVGKSSLINKLLSQDRIATKEIGKKTGRGRHTTTAREMYFMNGGGIIIDNPGSREVGVIDFGDGANDLFADIQKLALECKFKDCQHVNEKGCAVLVALNLGEINAGQYENYLKLRKETEHYEMSEYEKRQKDKKFGKFIKNAKADLKKYKY